MKKNMNIISKEMAKTSKSKLERTDKFVDEKFGELLIFKDPQKVNMDCLMITYDYNSLYLSAQAKMNSSWPKIETAYLSQKLMSVAICTLFYNSRWDQLNRSAFLTV